MKRNLTSRTLQSIGQSGNQLLRRLERRQITTDVIKNESIMTMGSELETKTFGNLV